MKRLLFLLVLLANIPLTAAIFPFSCAKGYSKGRSIPPPYPGGRGHGASARREQVHAEILRNAVESRKMAVYHAKRSTEICPLFPDFSSKVYVLGLGALSTVVAIPIGDLRTRILTAAQLMLEATVVQYMDQWEALNREYRYTAFYCDMASFYDDILKQADIESFADRGSHYWRAIKKVIMLEDTVRCRVPEYLQEPLLKDILFLKQACLSQDKSYIYNKVLKFNRDFTSKLLELQASKCFAGMDFRSSIGDDYMEIFDFFNLYLSG